MISVSLVDDDPKVIDFFRQTTLETTGVVCVRAVTNLKEYLKYPIHTKSRHFLFLDIYLQDRTSLNHIPKILHQMPNVEVIIYTVDEEYQQLINAFKLGASGYIVKQFRKAYLKEFFSILDQGGAVISPKMARKLISSINHSLPSTLQDAPLTEREIQILNYLAEGWTYQYIADQLEVTIDGVRYYIKRIYKRLNVKTRAEAVRKFRGL